MQDLANVLTGQVDRMVVAQSGFNGKRFDIALQWTPDLSTPGGNGPEAPPDPGGPALVTALAEQLGLRLEPSKGPA